MSNRNAYDRYVNCLLGGAAGDALGHPVEFAKGLDKHFPLGVRDFLHYRKGLVTDDTQMTLFGAEAILLTPADAPREDLISAVWAAYQRWLLTQECKPAKYAKFPGFLGKAWMNVSRAPGGTCLSALRHCETVYGSKGCGGVMRAAPFGLQAQKSVRECFHDAVDAAWLTHGHPDGYLPAGAMAAIIRCLIEGMTLEKACYCALRILRDWKGSKRTQAVIYDVLETAKDVCPQTSWKTMREIMCEFGGGWVGDEAFAIGLFAVMAVKNRGGNMDDILALAVTHDGDSDSTGSIAGNIAGAAGFAVSTKMLIKLEGVDDIRSTAEALMIATEKRQPVAYGWTR